MHKRQLGAGGLEVSAIGLGCMGFSHAYGAPPDAQAAARVLLEALDLGYTLFDTAALYGFGANETLLGQTLSARRGEFVLASKCGMFRNSLGVREIDGRPATLRRTVEDSLVRLRAETIDLCYLHRWDKRIAIEDSVGALSEMVATGKVRCIGLCEVSARTLERAQRVHPITALQTEYSLWTRNPEIAVIEQCRRLGVAFVAFSPLGRGFLAGGLPDVEELQQKDIRRQMPRFEPANHARNLRLYRSLSGIANEVGCTAGQLALAWLLARGADVIPIPGTTRADHLAENAAACEVQLSANIVARLDALINSKTVAGPRYNADTQSEIDTEEFA